MCLKNAKREKTNRELPKWGGHSKLTIYEGKIILPSLSLSLFLCTSCITNCFSFCVSCKVIISHVGDPHFSSSSTPPRHPSIFRGNDHDDDEEDHDDDEVLSRTKGRGILCVSVRGRPDDGHPLLISLTPATWMPSRRRRYATRSVSPMAFANPVISLSQHSLVLSAHRSAGHFLRQS